MERPRHGDSALMITEYPQPGKFMSRREEGVVMSCVPTSHGFRRLPCLVCSGRSQEKEEEERRLEERKDLTMDTTMASGMSLTIQCSHIHEHFEIVLFLLFQG